MSGTGGKTKLLPSNYNPTSVHSQSSSAMPSGTSLSSYVPVRKQDYNKFSVYDNSILTDAFGKLSSSSSTPVNMNSIINYAVQSKAPTYSNKKQQQANEANTVSQSRQQTDNIAQMFEKYFGPITGTITSTSSASSSSVPTSSTSVGTSKFVSNKQPGTNYVNSKSKTHLSHNNHNHNNNKNNNVKSSETGQQYTPNGHYSPQASNQYRLAYEEKKSQGGGGIGGGNTYSGMKAYQSSQVNDQSQHGQSYESQRQSNGGGSGSKSPPVQAAVISKHQVSYIDVPSTPAQELKPTTIEVKANPVPINIILKSSSSKLNIQQEHQPSKGTVQQTESEDEPHILKHTVRKPIIQEVYEMITPYRFIKQELQPVQEEIQTIVARSEKQNENENGNYNNKNSVPSMQSQSSPSSSHRSDMSGGTMMYNSQKNSQMNLMPPESASIFLPMNGMTSVQEQAHHDSMFPYEPQYSNILSHQVEHPLMASNGENLRMLQHSAPVESETYLERNQLKRVLQREMLARINTDFVQAASNSILSSVYGSPAISSGSAFFTHSADSNSGAISGGLELAESERVSSTIGLDPQTLKEYLPLVYEVIDTMDAEPEVESDIQMKTSPVTATSTERVRETVAANTKTVQDNKVTEAVNFSDSVTTTMSTLDELKQTDLPTTISSLTLAPLTN